MALQKLEIVLHLLLVDVGAVEVPGTVDVAWCFATAAGAGGDPGGMVFPQLPYCGPRFDYQRMRGAFPARFQLDAVELRRRLDAAPAPPGGAGTDRDVIEMAQLAGESDEQRVPALLAGQKNQAGIRVEFRRQFRLRRIEFRPGESSAGHDFRAAEGCGTHLRVRTGRRERPGNVVFLTRQPVNPPLPERRTAEKFSIGRRRRDQARQPDRQRAAVPYRQADGQPAVCKRPQATAQLQISTMRHSAGVEFRHIAGSGRFSALRHRGEPVQPRIREFIHNSSLMASACCRHAVSS